MAATVATAAVEGEPVVQAVVRERAHGKAHAGGQDRVGAPEIHEREETRYWTKVLSPPTTWKIPNARDRGLIGCSGTGVQSPKRLAAPVPIARG